LYQSVLLPLQEFLQSGRRRGFDDRVATSHVGGARDRDRTSIASGYR
jgi:hypothetical protein